MKGAAAAFVLAFLMIYGLLILSRSQASTRPSVATNSEVSNP